MSTGEPHPLASGSRVLMHEQQWRDHTSYSIQTCGDTLGVMHVMSDGRDFNETEVVLWNWKTGQVLVVRRLLSSIHRVCQVPSVEYCKR